MKFVSKDKLFAIDETHQSPNFNERRVPIAGVNTIVFHYTFVDFDLTLKIFKDRTREASAHYIIDRDGQILKMVDEDKRAWHAGAGFWRGNVDLNSSSIGIEIINPGEGHGESSLYTREQMQSVILLANDIAERWTIPQYNMIGHSDLAIGRKTDPGIHFDWQSLADSDIGLWPEKNAKIPDHDPDLSYDEFIMKFTKSCLGYIGYSTRDMAATLRAFQLHYRPHNINGESDEETLAMAWSLVRQIVAIEKNNIKRGIPGESVEDRII